MATGIFIVVAMAIFFSLLLASFSASAQDWSAKLERVQKAELHGTQFRWQFEGHSLTGHLYKPKGDQLAALLVLPGPNGRVTYQTKVYCEKMRRLGYVVLALDVSQLDMRSMSPMGRAVAESLSWMGELIYVDSERIRIIGEIPSPTADGNDISKLLANYQGEAT